jgi:hypothetical protein
MDAQAIAALDLIDRQRASAHEAAHLTVALSLGRIARAYIWRADDAVNVEDLTSWGGQCLHWHPRYAARDGADRIAVIGMAGVCGEALLDDAEVIGLQVADYIGLDMGFDPSPTDIAHVRGSRLRESTLADRALKILRTHKRFWEWATLRLFEEHVITDGQAAEAFLAHAESAHALSQ